MEGEKRIPLEIFDELAGVKELSQPDKNKDEIIISPRVTPIYYAFLKENTKIFFSLVFKDFSKRISDFFTYLQSINSQNVVEKAPDEHRTDVKQNQDLKDISDITMLIKLLIYGMTFQFFNLLRLKKKFSKVGTSTIGSILEAFAKLKESFIGFFYIEKMQLPDDYVINEPDKDKEFKIDGIDSFLRKPRIITAEDIVNYNFAPPVVYDAVKALQDDREITKENLAILNVYLEETNAKNINKKIQESRDAYFTLLAREHEISGNRSEAGYFIRLNYDLNEAIELDEIELASTNYSSLSLRQQERIGLPWLKVWYQLIKYVIRSLKQAINFELYMKEVEAWKEANAEFLSALRPDLKVLEDEASVYEAYEKLYQIGTLSPFPLKAVKYARKSNFNFVTESQKAIDARKDEVAAQTRKRELWTDILGLFTLKLNKQ